MTVMLVLFLLLHHALPAFGVANIFFLHTSSEKTLGPFQRCAVESAARFNPEATVTVFSNSLKREPLLSLGLGPNVRLERFSYDAEFSAVSPELAAWFHAGSWAAGGYCHVNLADALRLALLYSRGGTYFDTDMVSVKVCVCAYRVH